MRRSMMKGRRPVRRFMGFARLLGSTIFALAPAAPALSQSFFVNEIVDGSPSAVGLYNSLVLDAKGNPHVTYKTATDLKYGTKVGGLWTLDLVDTPGDVGAYTGLALDSQGDLHVTYYDATNGNLKYASKVSGVWTIETADASVNDVGEYSSLAIDAADNLHVSYYDSTAGNLKYAKKAGGVWTLQVVDASANNVGPYSSLALDPQGVPHVAYRDVTATDLKYAQKANGGSWTIEIVEASANNSGHYISLAVDAQGAPHISYHDNSPQDLRYAERVDGVWTLETVDTGSFAGFYTSIALDAQANPHVAYQGGSDLKYARKVNGAWSIEVADGSAVSAGSYASLALDVQGNAYVTYLDGSNTDLKYATAAVRVLGPASGETWPVGSLQRVDWTGVGPVSITLATDGANFVTSLISGVISSPVLVRTPHMPSRFARIRVQRTSPLSTAQTDSFFTIDATIALAKFEAAAGDEGGAVRLAWETTPGPEADVRYRIERALSGSALFSPLHAGLLDRGEYVDADPGASARYRLIAVNGLGEEYALGETAIAPAVADGRSLAVSPSVSRGGEIQVAFRVASEFLASDVSVFDASGRLVRRLASGSFPAGIRSVVWDGTDDRGATVGAGVYFVRLAWGGQGRETQRVTLVR